MTEIPYSDPPLPDKKLFLVCVFISLAFLIYSLLTILIVFLIGPPPESIRDCFNFLSDNRFNGILRLDVLTVFIMPLYYILFYAIYTLLKKSNYHLSVISALLI